MPLFLPFYYCRFNIAWLYRIKPLVLLKQYAKFFAIMRHQEWLNVRRLSVIIWGQCIVSYLHVTEILPLLVYQILEILVCPNWEACSYNYSFIQYIEFYGWSKWSYATERHFHMKKVALCMLFGIMKQGNKVMYHLLGTKPSCGCTVQYSRMGSSWIS